jgi:hypothetical protein
VPPTRADSHTTNACGDCTEPRRKKGSLALWLWRMIRAGTGKTRAEASARNARAHSTLKTAAGWLPLREPMGRSEKGHSEILHVQDLLVWGCAASAIPPAGKYLQGKYTDAACESGSGRQRASIELVLAQLGLVRALATSYGRGQQLHVHSGSARHPGARTNQRGRGARVVQQAPTAEPARRPAHRCIRRMRIRSNPLEVRRATARLGEGM